MTKEEIELIFQIIAAIGSLATFGAFFMLFKRDKDKQNQIKELTKIAAVLENQSESLNQQNDLITQQVDIFRNTSILTHQNDQALNDLKEIEIKKLNLSVKPNLWVNGASQDGFRGELKIDLNNKGETAYLKKFNLISEDIELHDEHLPWTLEKGDRRYIFAKSKGNKHVSGAVYSLEIEYDDKLENRFIATLSGKGPSVQMEKIESAE